MGRGKRKRGRGKGKGAKRNFKEKQFQKCLEKNVRGDLEVDLFRAPKRSIILLKSKNMSLTTNIHPWLCLIRN